MFLYRVQVQYVHVQMELMGMSLGAVYLVIN